MEVRVMLENVIRNIIQTIVEEPLSKAVLEDELSKAPTDRAPLSPILIDKECNIYLTEYNNTKVDIPGHQAKALYIFYLLSPVGVANKNLTAHRETLKTIYQEVCKNDSYRSDLMVNGLLNRDGGICDATNKIRATFKKIIKDQQLFKCYIVGGKRNDVRQVPLPKHLIKIENELLNSIDWTI